MFENDEVAYLSVGFRPLNIFISVLINNVSTSTIIQHLNRVLILFFSLYLLCYVMNNVFQQYQATNIKFHKNGGKSFSSAKLSNFIFVVHFNKSVGNI